MIIDEMSREEIEGVVLATFHKVCCHNKELYNARQWSVLCGKNIPSMCDAIAVESFRRDWMPEGTQVVCEVLDRLTYAGNWTTHLDEQSNKAEL